MFCRTSTEQMSLRLDGMLGPDEIKRLEEHLSSCNDCRAQYLIMREADSLLRTSARRPLTPPIDFSARVMQRVAVTPVQRPNLWERERAAVEGGRQTVRLAPTMPLAGRLISVPAVNETSPPAQPQTGFWQGLGLLKQRRVQAYVGGLSMAFVLSLVVLATLASLVLNGAVDVPAPLAALTASVQKQAATFSLASLWQQVDGFILHLNYLLVGLLAAAVVVAGALWWRLVSWYFRNNGGEITA